MHRILKRFDLSERFLLVSLLTFFLFRFPSLFEPYWYGDEGIYQIIGAALNHGRELYTGIWDNKPPLLYIIYTLTQGNQFVARLLSFIVGLVSVLIFYFLSHSIFHKKTIPVGLTTVSFSLLLATPYLEGNIANAENFMLLPILGGMTLLSLILTHEYSAHSLFRRKPTLTIFIIGLLFGITFTIKIVGVFEYAAALVTLFTFTHQSVFKTVKKVMILSLGFFLPFLAFTLYFFLKGSLSSYFESLFLVNVSYVEYENFFLIPQGLLLFKVLTLVIILSLLYLKRKKIAASLIFILIWCSFALFSSYFSHRSYTHYLLLALPALTLLGGYLFTFSKRNVVALLFFVGIIGMLIFHFKPYPLDKTIRYYGNFFSYLVKSKSTYDYQRFFDADVPRDYAVAAYLKMHLEPFDEVFIWGNSAQIYVLSDTLPIGRYTVSYHINTHQRQKETQEALNYEKPRFFVLLNDQPLENISLHDYTYRVDVEGATIYERIN